ncbi:MAG: glycosyltransferase, partial [Candidatus Omnitrophica bacterium]|nr:glycosyltransferase [Candidatus Omnitrophota bacterium]
MTDKPVVAHIREVFFLPSETSLHTLISKQKNFKPLCLASAFKNLERFPFAREDCYRAAICRNRFERYTGELAGKYRAIPGLLRRLNVKILHAHFGPSGSFILPYARHNGIPLVTSFYGYDASQLAGQKSWQKRYRELFNGGSLFLAEGEYLSRRLIRMGCPPDKIRIQRTGIALERLPFRQRLPKKRGEKAILIFCGRLVEKKGLLYALEALRDLRDTDTNFEFRVIGDGGLKNKITAFIVRNKMQGYVRLLGALDYEGYI